MTLLYLNSDRIGNGDEKLGRILLESFLEKLAKADIKIDHVVCLNSAIELTTEGSHVRDILEKLEERGANIATCGTCLDYYKRRDKLLIGQIGTMDQTVKMMLEADKIIQPC